MQKNNSLSIRLIAFFISLLINALGNVFTIYSNLGSSIWTTAAVNLNDIFKGPLSIYILAFGIFNIIVNQILIGHLDYIRALGEFAYTLLFSYLIDFFSRLFVEFGLGNVNLFWRFFEVIIGVLLICVAISLYQRTNIIMHPNDDMSNLMRFKLFQGSAVVSQLVDMAIPAVFVLICFMFTHSVSALGFGTIISLFCNAFLIKYADKYVFPSLVHNFNKSDNM